MEDISLNFQVHGNFNKKESDDLRNFITMHILDSRCDYFLVMKDFCDKRGYVVYQKDNVISIHK